MTTFTQNFDATKHFNDDLAVKYDHRIRLFCPSYDALHQMIVPLLEPLHPDSHFLAAGAGTGAEIFTLAKRFPSWRFTAIDISPDMLNACEQRTAKAGINDRVTFFCGRLQDYQASTLYDGASSIFVSHFLRTKEEKLSYFRSIASKLKPNAPFVFADLFGENSTIDFTTLKEAWLAFYAGHGISKQELIQDRQHIERDVSFISEAELYALLQEAGFSIPLRFYQTFLFGGWVAKRTA